MERLIQVVGVEIEWELGVELKTARHLLSHAPTNLHPDGPRWWERAPVISRLITVYDRMRDFPRGTMRR